MSHIKIFIELTRLNKPIGFMLLFWPCAWGLAIALKENENLDLFKYYACLFFFGSVLMRSAGCIFNDIVDKDFDKKVSRTKKRPIASGEISVLASSIYVFTLCLIAFFILIQFNFLTICLGLGSMLLAFTYPFMKRITYWPQLFLGITFNWGIIMAWAAINGNITLEIFTLYISAIFWTLGYDTIYGGQDMSDDEIIGLKSTAIKFKTNLKLFVLVSYSISISLLIYVLNDYIGFNTTTIFLLMFCISLLYQVLKLKNTESENYLKLFKFNNYSGLILFIAIFSINF